MFKQASLLIMNLFVLDVIMKTVNNSFYKSTVLKKTKRTKQKAKIRLGMWLGWGTHRDFV